MRNWIITRYNIHIDREEAGRGKVKALFLTDLHNAHWGDKFELLMEVIDDEEPDMILIGGDIITAVPGATTDFGEEFIKELVEKYPVYYALGNHEYRLRLYPETYGDLGEKYFRMLIDSGVHFLPNRKAELEMNGVRFNIFGLSIKRRFYKRFHHEDMPVTEISRIFGSPSEDAVNILLAHTPTYIETYIKWGADLTLCGHFHGGLIRFGENIGLIGPDLRLFTRRARGRFDENNKTCIVSAGLGEHTIHTRINNPREIVALEITVG